MQPSISRDRFIQINIVVKDIEKAAKAWSEILGIPVPEIRLNHLESHEQFRYTYRGNETPCDLKVCNIDMGNFVLELHEPVGGDSSFQEYLDRHGNGVHHIGCEVGDQRDEVLDALKEMGFDTQRTVGYYPGSSWTIVDSEDELGVNLNIKPVR